MLELGVSVAALLAWLGVLLSPWQAHRTRERLDPRPAADASSDFADITVLVPARNEADVIGRMLAGLARQGRRLRVLVVDDESDDGTADICRRFDDAALSIEVLPGRPLPRGWGGKLWALEQGLARVETPYTLLLDADIELAPGMLEALRGKRRATGASLVSVMAQLDTTTAWDKLLAPPFVFFFKLIYPFARVNAPGARTAAAAGGCMLVETPALRDAGAFDSIRGALIDDCTLAARLKARGHGLWLGLSHGVRSLRPYGDLASFWPMVSRSAFTQLRYSAPLLLAVTLANGRRVLGAVRDAGACADGCRCRGERAGYRCDVRSVSADGALLRPARARIANAAGRRSALSGNDVDLRAKLLGRHPCALEEQELCGGQGVDVCAQ